MALGFPPGPPGGPARPFGPRDCPGIGSSPGVGSPPGGSLLFGGLRNAPAPGSLGAAEAVLLAECGADVVQALQPHYSALLSVADLAAGQPHIRALLRFVGDLHKRWEAAEEGAQRWHSRCSAAETQLQRAQRELEVLRDRAVHDQCQGSDLQARLAASQRECTEVSTKVRTLEECLGGELERCRGEVLRLGALNQAQSQSLAAEQAAMIACNHEIHRLRVELEVTGTMGRQQAGALEAARLHAAGADLTAEQATQERVRMEALLKHATREQHEEAYLATESATAEAMRLRQRVQGHKSELQGFKQVLATQEALWAEIRSAAPCAAAAAEFLRDPGSPAALLVSGPLPLAAGGPAPVRIPVLALRWGPHLTLNTMPDWKALRAGGLYATFQQLQTGATPPEQLELTVCCAEGRWFCTREEEGSRFAALLMFQALHRDRPVLATCRVSTAHALLGVPEAELASIAGLGVRSTGSLWRTPPLDDEDFLRIFLHESPLRERYEEFLYQQRRGRVQEAFEEEARRDPFSAWLPAAAATSPAPAPAPAAPWPPAPPAPAPARRQRTAV